MGNMYRSTRGGALRTDFFESVLCGLADDGGLLVPDFPLGVIPTASLQGLSYAELASVVMAKFVDAADAPLIAEACAKAYAAPAFPREVVPVKKAGDVWVAELFHGPTAAFKDMALQLLPHLMRQALRRRDDDREALILAATSGDTGKAALEGFSDVEGTRINVFYPADGVSAVQRLQMVTQRGGNVDVVAVRGNFDDAQRAVKEAFASPELAQQCAEKGLLLTSANSINIGRLVPQVTYWFHAYAQMVAQGAVAEGESINVVVPSGNFGNCLAGVIARRMGLPVRRFIVASNRNNVLTDFFTTGCYDARRTFCKTNSPAMDILVSSNLERLLYMLSDDTMFTASLMQQLRDKGMYRVSGAMMTKLHEMFRAGWLDEADTEAVIGRWFERTGCLFDTHTAVAVGVLERYREQSGDTTPTVVLSTASPYKFPVAVCRAVTGHDVPEEIAAEVLNRTTGVPIPSCLEGIMERPVLHNRVVDPQDIVPFVADSL